MSESVTDKVNAFFARFPLRSYPKGQILIHAGEKPEHIYCIVKGSVRQYDISYRGDEIVVNIFKAGAFFPMLWAVTDLPNRYFFDTETDCDAYVAPIQDTVEFLKSNPDVTYDLLIRVYRGMDGILGRLVHLMSANAGDRLLYELVIECRRSGERAQDKSVMITLNESGLAARTGLSRETISREMQKLSKAGLASISHGTILIKNVSLLEKKLGYQPTS